MASKKNFELLEIRKSVNYRVETRMGEKKISVIGVGTMGCGIAQVAAQAGYQVLLHDSDASRTGPGLQRIKKNLNRLAEKGELSKEAASATGNRIFAAEKFEDLAGSFFLIEAIVEDRDEKMKLFAKVDALCGSQAVMASNTSSIPITDLASCTQNPQNVIGMHFMNPVPLMPGVEIVRGLKTSLETFEKTKRLAEEFLKKPVYSSDRAGFVVNRIVMPFINEAIAVVEEGTASIGDVDRGALFCLNHPLGPLALSDLIGNDTTHHILSVMEKELGERFKPAPLLTRMVQAGFLGNKCGAGFYIWKDNKSQQVNGEVERYLTRR